MRPAAQRLAEFISQVPKIGLRQARTNAGLADVEKLKPDEIALAVADVLVTDASQLIMTELRDALATVVEELCENAQSLEQAEQKITPGNWNPLSKTYSSAISWSALKPFSASTRLRSTATKQPIIF